MGKSDKKDKKEKKRADNEAATVVVEAEAVTAAGVGAPAADAGEVSMAVDGETSTVTAAKKDKKSKKDKKDKKDGATSSKKDSSKKEKSKERKELEIPADALSPIAHPLAGRKLNKSTLKLVKRGVWTSLLALSPGSCSPSIKLTFSLPFEIILQLLVLDMSSAVSRRSSKLSRRERRGVSLSPLCYAIFNLQFPADRCFIPLSYDPLQLRDHGSRYFPHGHPHPHPSPGRRS